MSAEKVLKEAKITISVLLLVSIGLFSTWLIVETRNVFADNQALLALSLIPFSAALASSVKLFNMKKDTQVLISETDERLVAEKNEADAKTLKVLQGVLFFFYLGYTFMIPEDIFTSVIWWVMLGIFLLSLFAPLFFRHMLRKNHGNVTRV